MLAIEKSGHLDKVILGMDVAASEFYENGKYDLDKKVTTGTKKPLLTGKKNNTVYH
jgi:enolase